MAPLTPHGLKPLIETLKLHNNTLRSVDLHKRFRSESETIKLACAFNIWIQYRCYFARRGSTEQTESTLVKCLALWQSFLPHNKLTVLFYLARGRTERLVQWLRTTGPTEDTLGLWGGAADQPKQANHGD